MTLRVIIKTIYKEKILLIFIFILFIFHERLIIEEYSQEQ